MSPPQGISIEREHAMTRKIFVNLPVKDLERSMSFFKQLGFKFNPQFTDDTAACMVIADDIYAMLLTYAKFKTFTKKEIADATRFTEVLTALSFESKAQVNEFVDTALKAGAIESGQLQDHGFMYGRSFDDLDGHTWEIFWMDPNHIQKT
jgi:uncharacterized protein